MMCWRCVTIPIDARRDWTGTHTTPVKNQGNCGGCWAESAIAQVESDAMREHGWTGVLSTQELIDCTADGDGSWAGGCGGGRPYLGYEVLQSLGGVVSGYDYKYEGRDARCAVGDLEKYVGVAAYNTVGKTTRSK